METKVKLRLDYDSKVFRSMLKSALYILLLPILVSIALAAAFVHNMEREAEGFREVVLDKIADEVNHELRAAYQLINSVRNTDLITSYAKTEERDYWTEYQIYKYMSKVLIGTNLEMAYLYYPQYEFVFSDTGGVESEYFHGLNYEGSYEDWQDILRSRWNGKMVQLQGKDLGYRNVVISNVLNDRGEEACAVIAVQLSNEYVNQLIANLQLETGDRILIYNANGIVGSNFDATGQAALAELLESVGRMDRGTIQFDGVTYEVRVRYSPQYGLTFAYASPKDIVHASFAFIRFYSAAAVLFCIIFSLALCFAVTKHNYRPIKRLFGLFREPGEEGEAPDDYDKMEQCITECLYKNRNLLSTVKRYENDYREVYLEKILYGRIRYLEGVEESSRLYGLGLEAPCFAVVFYELTEESDENLLETRPESDGTGLLKDALSAYIEEKMAGITRFYIIEEYNGCVGVLNGEAADLTEFCARIERDNVRILEEMEIQEGICCQGYVSGVPGGLTHLHEGYEQVMRRRKEAEDKEEEQQQADLGGALRIDCIVATVREQMAKPDLSVAGLADEFHVSASHLSRFFKQQMGVGLLDYIHRCRINEAKELMKNNPSIRVKEVADRTGFYNVSAFIRVFKKIEDMTPGQYREKM